MENSPPGIQTMPSGVGPGGGMLFATVGWNEADDIGAVAECWAAASVQPHPPVTKSTAKMTQLRAEFKQLRNLKVSPTALASTKMMLGFFSVT